jgi:site-specific recombinase XerD
VKFIIGSYEATIYREGDGYTGALSLGFDAAGKRKRIKRKGRTKAQVKDKLREVVDDLESGVAAGDSGYTVGQAVDDFLAHGMKGKAKTTIDGYRSISEHHLAPFLGAAKLKQLTADDLDKWMDDRAQVLSTRTLRLAHQLLERSIRHAQARDKVRRNVASLIILPDGQEGRPSKAMTLDQALTLLDEVGPRSPHRLAAYVVLSLLSGVRTEEARALTWAEVDLRKGTMAVYRSVRAKGDTKTPKSRRLLRMPKRATESLTEHRKRQAAERLHAGNLWHDHDLVFCPEDGTPLDRWQVRREFAAITRAAGLGDQWAPRELRHSFVSILSASGMRIEDISDLVGHSGTSVTEAVYRHEIRPALTKGATAMDEILGKRSPTPTNPDRQMAPRVAPTARSTPATGPIESRSVASGRPRVKSAQPRTMRSA